MGEKKKSLNNFIFENKWIIEDNFLDKAKQFWNSIVESDSLPKKLENCGKLLSNWAKHEVWEIQV